MEQWNTVELQIKQHATSNTQLCMITCWTVLYYMEQCGTAEQGKCNNQHAAVHAHVLDYGKME
jgi:hypothetical protein